jgi:hypothetical protein
MTTIKIVGALTAADQTNRTVTGLVLPFGSEGRTSAGTVTASKDSVEIAKDVIFNLEHVNTKPIGKMISHAVTDAGLEMTFSVAKTTAGNDLLAEISEGLRTGLSVEVQEPVIRNGSLIGGLLDAVAAVTRPAFDLARVSAMTAADSGEIEDDGPVEDDETTDELSDDEAETTEVDAENDEDEEDPEDATASEDIEQEDQTVTKTATASLAASAASGKDTIKTTGEFVSRLVAAKSTGDRQLLAALADITQSGVGGDVSAQQFLGELWSGKDYTRTVVPLMAGGALTSYSVKGWRWVTKPEVAAYAGNKAAVTSNSVDTEAVTVAAERLAGAHDIDRKFADFGDTEFLTSYLQAMTESYARKSDGVAVDFLQANATAVSPGTVPTGISNAAAALVDGALAVIDAGVPNYAFVDKGAYRSLLLTPKDQILEYLNMALGLEEGSIQNFKIVPRSDLLPGQLIVGCTPAVQFLELPGVPIRVDALNIANGGVDQGVFGYYAQILHNADGLAKVSLAAASIDAGADFAMTVGADDGSAGPTVYAVYGDGSRIDITSDPACVLTSATPAKATIVNNKVHAVAAGTSVITATYQGKTDTVTVTVS